MSTVDAIGIFGTLLTVIGFFQSNFPGSDPQGARVQIKAGLGDDTSSNLGGHIDATYGFDINNNYLGASGGGSMGDGGVVELTIDQNTPGVQSDYVSISNGNDATCIAWVSVRQYDGSAGGAWTGDIGKNCGLAWFKGNQQAGNNPDGSSYRPKCAWFDGDHTNGIQNAAFKFRVRAYGEEADDTIRNNNVCASTIFGRDTGAINGRPAKRALSLPWVTERLIVSTVPGDNADELCDSETSYGPDFVGDDGMLCDMSTKTMIPLCSKEEVDGCVEVDIDNKVIHKHSSIAHRAAKTVWKSYNKVSIWD